MRLFLTSVSSRLPSVAPHHFVRIAMACFTSFVCWDVLQLRQNFEISSGRHCTAQRRNVAQTLSSSSIICVWRLSSSLRYVVASARWCVSDSWLHLNRRDTSLSSSSFQRIASAARQTQFAIYAFWNFCKIWRQQPNISAQVATWPESV